MVEDWLSLSNDCVHEMLLESARPRTRELYSRDLVHFIGKNIPQSPDMNTDNFNKIFYVPLMKSLNDVLNLHDLLSADTSRHSNNAAKMPPITYGTRDTPGHIALWILSLGNQKDAVLQWLGKDELMKHKSVESSVKYIRSKFLEGRSNSEARQDFDAKLTPIRYEEIRHTQGESFQRQQIHSPARHTLNAPDHGRYKDSKPRITFAALDEPTQDSYAEHYDEYNDDDDTDGSSLQHTEHTEECYDDTPDFSQIYSQKDTTPTSINAMSEPNTFRSTISATFRGFCSELFVFGHCSKLHSECSYDHSSAGLEMCIKSFSLLSKRELMTHGQLPTPPSAPLKTD
jgi:hypothetical protein